MNELALFAGAGGGLLASRLLGWTTVAAVEINLYCQDVLLRRQRDGCLQEFPVWDDVRTFDGKPWAGLVDVVTGGFPCQDVSVAGKGLGVGAGERSGLWREFARIIGEVGPRFAFIENSSQLVTRGLDIVLADLAGMGYDARWCVLGAWHVGGLHRRDRMWILAYSDEKRQPRKTGRSVPQKIEEKERQSDKRSSGVRRQSGCQSNKENLSDAGGVGLEGLVEGGPEARAIVGGGRGWWQAEPGLGRVAHGVARIVDRLEAIGNGQVPQVAAVAFLLLSEGLIPAG